MSNRPGYRSVTFGSRLLLLRPVGDQDTPGENRRVAIVPLRLDRVAVDVLYDAAAWRPADSLGERLHVGAFA